MVTRDTLLRYRRRSGASVVTTVDGMAEELLGALDFDDLAATKDLLVQALCLLPRAVLDAEDTSGHEERLDMLMDAAFAVDHPAMLDYVRLKFELRAARRQLANLAVCPDHRGKDRGEECAICRGERRGRDEERRRQEESRS